MASGKYHHETDRKLRPLRSFSCDVYSGYSNIALRRAMKPSPVLHSKNKWGSEGPLKVLQFVPNTGPYLVLRGTPTEGASKDPLAMVL